MWAIKHLFLLQQKEIYFKKKKKRSISVGILCIKLSDTQNDNLSPLVAKRELLKLIFALKTYKTEKFSLINVTFGNDCYLCKPSSSFAFHRFDYVLSREHRESFARVFSSLKCRTVTFSITWELYHNNKINNNNNNTFTGNIQTVFLDYSRNDTYQICIGFILT